LDNGDDSTNFGARVYLTDIINFIRSSVAIG